MAAKTNYTGVGTQITPSELFCSAELTGSIHSQLMCLSVLNIFLSITAFLGNTLILVALSKEMALHPPSKLLLRSLAATNLCVGIIIQPLHVTHWISAVYEQWDICRSTFATFVLTGRMLFMVSLLTLTAISVDTLLALLLGLRYRQVVTIKRTYVTVIAFWVSSFVGSTIFLWNELLSLRYTHIVTLLCLLTSIYSYTRIFLRLRHHQTQVQDNVTEQTNQTILLNIARYRKTVQYTVAAVDISSLLFTTDCSGNYCNSRNSKWTVFSIFSSVANYNNVIIFELIIKPNSLLLEDQRSETSSEGYNLASPADVLRCSSRNHSCPTDVCWSERKKT